MDKMLVVSNDVSMAEELSGTLKDQFVIISSAQKRPALGVLSTNLVSAILIDCELSDSKATELLRAVRHESPRDIPVFVLSDHVDIETAVQARRLGAYDILPRKINPALLLEKLKQAIHLRAPGDKFSTMQLTAAAPQPRMMFASDVMKKVHNEVIRLAHLNFDVLLVGETGVGKDMIAYEIHRRSDRWEKPFVHVAIGSLNETLIESELFGHEKGAFSGAEKSKIGKLEAANGGTIYIPELSSLTETVQLKLLQFMQYKNILRVGQDPQTSETKLDVRLIMATNEPLDELMMKGKIRSDFYYRVTGVMLHIPPLRDRPDDISLLVEFFLKRFSAGNSPALTVHPDAMEALVCHKWPGNVRELENTVKSAVAHATGTVLDLDDFPALRMRPQIKDFCPSCGAAKSYPPADYKTAEEKFRRAYFQEIVAYAKNNITKAARISGMTPQGLRRTLRALHIDT